MQANQTANYDDLVVTPLQPRFGAEIHGIDDVRSLDERQLIQFRDLLLRYSVVVVHDQHLSPREQSSLVARLYPLAKMPGGVRPTKPGENRAPEDVQVQVFSNAQPDAGVLWHTDTVFNPEPELFISQHAITVPHDSEGNPLGPTLYRSTAAAYDALDDDERRQLFGLQAINSYAYHMEKLAESGLRRRAAPTKEQWEELGDTIQPVIRVHPITGRPCIYVSEGFTAAIVGMSDEQSRSTLNWLFAHVARPEFSYTHNWREGDFVVWDNSVTQHRATPNYGDIPRHLHRCSTHGPVPIGIDGTVGGHRVALHNTPA
jgi:taurine dioxygenase